MGAGGVGLAVARGLRLDAAVFVGPPRSPWEFLDAFCRSVELSPSVGERLVHRIERRVGVSRAELDLPAIGRGLAVPLLVVHDAEDREIPHADGAAVAAGWPGARLVTTRGLGHRRILRDGGVARAAVEFVAAHLPRCATCGRLAWSGEGERARCAACDLAQELYDRASRARAWPAAAH
jgi:pimeloyl-ACP methyl ester carboxylesterase